MKKNILLVGGTSGIGASTLKQLVDHHIIYNLSRSTPDYNHSNLIHHSVNVLTDDLPEIEEVDTIIYCPGSINLKPIGSLKIEDFRNDFEINVIGAVRVIKKYLRKLKASSSGSIILFSTVATKQGMPFHSSVSAAKSGVEGLAISLAAELAPKIRVNCIAPSLTDTPLAAGILRNEKSRENMEQRHPLKRILKPEEIASMINFLISESAASMSGQIIPMDAGISTLKI